MRFRFLPAAAIVTIMTLASQAQADMAHWFFQAKVDFGAGRVYDLDSDGVPLADKRQGRTRTSQKLLGVFDKPRKVCLSQGEWSKGPWRYVGRNKERIEFLVPECHETRILIHFNRPIEAPDQTPEAMWRYLSGMFEIVGFATGDPVNEVDPVEIPVAESSIRIGSLELPRTGDYEQTVYRYGGGLRLNSTAADGDSNQWSTSIASRPMTPEERSAGSRALAASFRSDQLRLLNAAFGKNLDKQLQIAVDDAGRAPRLRVQHTPSSYSYRRRDYIFDDASATIYYLESSARRRKYAADVDGAVSRLLAEARFHEARLPSSTLSSLTSIPETPAQDQALDAPASTGESTGPAPQPYNPSIEIESVSVQPVEVSPGDEMKLLVQYRVGGLPPGTEFQVNEVRELLVADSVIAKFDQASGRGEGTHTSDPTIAVSTEAKSGIYTLRVRLSLAGVTAEGSALFRVR